jgi:3-methyladenine DNA glycosylase AlkD
VRNPEVHSIAKSAFKIFNSTDKQEIFAICESLFQSGYNEEAIIPADWTFFVKRKYEISGIHIFKRWIDMYITNWASCDTFCTKSIGYLIDRFPEIIQELKSWTSSENRWMRRAAAVSLVAPARRGRFLPDILEIAGLLLTDEDDLVQKGYGWMLKEASKPHQQEIFDFVIQHKDEMPRTALRYAIEKMPDEHKALAMKK